MSKIIDNKTVITKINRYKPIIAGMIQDTNIGMVLLNDDIDNLTTQLQFDSVLDVDYLIDRLNILKMQMEVNENAL